MLVITCSFRSFNGSSNDTIQHAFLNSLRLQTHHFNLVVVQFGESGVKDQLFGIPHTFIEKQGPWGHSIVLSEAIKKFPDSNIVHTSVDVIFPPNFVEVFSQTLTRFPYATTWPYSSEVEKNIITLAKSSLCLDLIGFSSKITKDILLYAERFPNIKWGLTEHLFVNFAYLSSSRKRGINVFKSMSISRLETPHSELGEMNYHLRKQWNDNLERWKPWISVSPFRRIWISIFWVLLKFKKTPTRIQIWLIWGLIQQTLVRVSRRTLNR